MCSSLYINCISINLKKKIYKTEKLQNRFDITHKNKDINPLRSFDNQSISGIIKKQTKKGC